MELVEVNYIVLQNPAKIAGDNMNQKPEKLKDRIVYVGQALWDKVKDDAEKKGVTISSIVRDLLGKQYEK